MKTMKAAELVLDFDLYPRNNVDTANIARIVEAMTAGETMPAVIIDKKSKRVVDGFHRTKAAIRLYGADDAKVEVIEKTYADDAAMFLDAMKYNATHGARLDSCDRVHCVHIAERLSIPLDAIAGALHMPVDRLGALRTDRTATTKAGGLVIPLKRTVSHQFAGKTLNKRQEEANTRLSGMQQVFYANQLIELLESKMLDTSDDKLMERLQVLQGLLETVLVTA